jgi:tRNA-modifying protein YgfZ
VLSADDAARSGALFVPRPDLGTLTVTGPDRLEWLQGVLTCDVAQLAEGDGRWGLVLSKQGKILADALVVAAAGAVHLGVVADAASRVHGWLAGFLIMEDAELVEATPSLSWVTLHGPLSGAVAAEIVARLGGASAPMDVTGLGGAAVVLARGQAEAARSVAAAAGAVVSSPEEWERLRVERLVPLYGADMSDALNPHEASLDRRAVSWSKGCYLGQEAVCMQDMRGKVKKRLALLHVESTSLPPSGTPVKDPAGVVVGDTRSAVESHLFGGPLTVALLAAGVAAPGTGLRVGDVPAVVVEPSR